MGLYGAISSGLRKVGVFPEETGIDSPMWDNNKEYDRLFGSDVVNSVNPPDLFSAIDEPLARAEQIAKAARRRRLLRLRSVSVLSARRRPRAPRRMQSQTQRSGLRICDISHVDDTSMI